jgi:hypothetical protein
MKKIFVALVLLTGIGMTGCNSEQKTGSSADSILNDTAIMDTSSMDSINQIDTAVRSNTRVDTASSVLPVP